MLLIIFCDIWLSKFELKVNFFLTVWRTVLLCFPHQSPVWISPLSWAEQGWDEEHWRLAPWTWRAVSHERSWTLDTSWSPTDGWCGQEPRGPGYCDTLYRNIFQDSDTSGSCDCSEAQPEHDSCHQIFSCQIVHHLHPTSCTPPSLITQRQGSSWWNTLKNKILMLLWNKELWYIIGLSHLIKISDWSKVYNIDIWLVCGV